MDWFKRKQGGAAPPPGAPKSPPPPTDTTQHEESAPTPTVTPTADDRLHSYEEEMKETVAEYTRKLESLAQILFDKSEENDQLVAKLSQQEEDMKVLIDKMVSSEKELETYKDNQGEYKRRLEVLTDCLEDLARENMKLAARGAPASRPDDYEEDRMPTLQEVQMQKTKSEVAAESAAKEVPIKPGMRSNPPASSSPTLVHTSKSKDTSSPSTRRRDTSSSGSSIESSSSTPDISTSDSSDNESSSKPKELHARRHASGGGLVLPSKSKSKPDVRDSHSPKREDGNSSTKPTTPPPSSSHSSHKHGHKRVPSNENDTFANLSNDPKALMTVLKKYKGQADSLRRVRRPSIFLPSYLPITCFSPFDSQDCYILTLSIVMSTNPDTPIHLSLLQDLIRERQKSESLQLSIDTYEEKTTANDKFYRDNLLKESKRRKDAEYIANVLKKRVTELQFLLDEKDDSDHDSDSDGERRKDDDDDDEDD